MPRGFRLNWRGMKVGDSVLEAARKGVDETMAVCVPLAKSETPVVTGTAQGSIAFQPSQIRRTGVVGRWGSFDVVYFIWLEIGARCRAGIHMLTRAADREYPKLARRIRSHL